MKTFFTADLHFKHANIIKYCNRPFDNIKSMDTYLIRNWNSRVSEDDLIYIIGDFGFNGAGDYIHKLNGDKIFIRGNHDRTNMIKTHIESLQIKMGGKYINLVHNPDNRNVEYELNFTGHVHNQWKIKQMGRYYNINGSSRLIKSTICINVGVDVWNFQPITFNEIMKEYFRWVKHEGSS